MNFVVFTCTYYPSTSDLRYVQFLETLQAAKKHAVRIVVVDGSPDDVHKALKEGYDGRDGAVLRGRMWRDERPRNVRPRNGRAWNGRAGLLRWAGLLRRRARWVLPGRGRGRLRWQ